MRIFLENDNTLRQSHLRQLFRHFTKILRLLYYAVLDGVGCKAKALTTNYVAVFQNLDKRHLKP